MEPRKHYFAKIPTIAIFIVMAMSGPLGVLLFILKGIDQKVQKEEQEAACARGDYRPAPEPASTQKANASYGQDIPTAEQKAPNSGTRILPPSAPSWVPFSCLPG